MDFCKRLYIETKDYHKQVNIHPFVELIKVQEDAGKNYMIFNIKCIEEIQKHIKLKDVILQEKLYRKNDFDVNVINEDLFIENVKKSYDLIKNVFDDLI